MRLVFQVLGGDETFCRPNAFNILAVANECIIITAVNYFNTFLSMLCTAATDLCELI